MQNQNRAFVISHSRARSISPSRSMVRRLVSEFHICIVLGPKLFSSRDPGPKQRHPYTGRNPRRHSSQYCRGKEGAAFKFSS